MEIGQGAQTASRNDSSTPAEGRRIPPDAPMHRRTALLMCPRWRGATATETLFDRGPQVLELYISHLKGPKGFERLLLYVGRKLAQLGHKRGARAALSEAGPVKPKFKTVANPTHLLIVVKNPSPRCCELFPLRKFCGEAEAGPRVRGMARVSCESGHTWEEA